MKPSIGELAGNVRGVGEGWVVELMELLRKYSLELAEEKDGKFRKKLEKYGML